MDKINEYLNKTIEDVFAERFGRYSKYIIQERALPDVRDGLKPVQRRILYAMYKDRNTFERQFRKSAKTVGNVIGNYHPHGDSSVYEAMVRMSQTWKINEQLVIMHGNNGSIDGDNPAAMRYTEAKLSEYSNYMLSDIDQDVVTMVPNFDDTEFEPSVLPTRVPNLLINGTSGIASGYATEIPPHNMSEVLKAAIFFNKNRDATLSQLMKYIKAPDFPTGGIISGLDGVKKAYATGRGKLVLRAKYRIEKQDIIITEIPYDVNKSTLLQKIELLKLDRKVEGISEILDQSGKEGLEIKISCQSSANPEIIMNFLLKNTDLQKNYNFNMTAINNKKPEVMGIAEILESFLKHREDVILKRSETLLEKNRYRLHILEGMISAISNLDAVVEIIRGSLDKQDAKANLQKEFKFSDEQAEAIVTMQLYRLTNTDILSLEESYADLKLEIKGLEEILGDRRVLLDLMEEELQEVLQNIKSPRKTQIEKEYVEISVNKEDLIKEETNIVIITEKKYIKRSSLRSYLTAKSNPQLLEGDRMERIIEISNKDKLIFFFDNGQYALVPVYDIPENKWKEMGKPLGLTIKNGEIGDVVGVYKYEDTNGMDVISVTRDGYIIKIDNKEFLTSKLRQRIKFQGLKKDDVIVSTTLAKSKTDLMLLTDNDKYQIVNAGEIERAAIKRVGRKIKGINKKEHLVMVGAMNKEILLYNDAGYYFRVSKKDITPDNFRFEVLFQNVKSSPQLLDRVVIDPEREMLSFTEDATNEVPLSSFKLSKVGDKIKSSTKINDTKLLSNAIGIK